MNFTSGVLKSRHVKCLQMFGTFDDLVTREKTKLIKYRRLFTYQAFDADA